MPFAYIPFTRRLRRGLLALVGVSLAALGNSVALAQGTYPDRPIKLVVTAVMAQPEVRSLMVGQCADAMSATPEGYAAYVRAEVVKWGKVVRESGARVE